MKNLTILLNGLKRLINGQKQFAAEFGLSLNRVFPQLTDPLQQLDCLQEWLESEDPAAESYLENLLLALAQHQIALLAALDGVALHTLQQLPEPSSKLSLVIRTPPLLETLKKDRQLRYQKLILPGFVTTYLRMRENL